MATERLRDASTRGASTHGASTRDRFSLRAMVALLACAALGVVLALAGALDVSQLAVLVLALAAAYAVATVAHAIRRRTNLRTRFDALAADSPLGTLTPDELLTLPRDAADFPGAYVIHNATRRRTYAGTSTAVRRALRRHLAGKGHETLHADYRAGDDLTIKSVPLAATGYPDLAALAADVTYAYDAREIRDPLAR